MSGFVDRVDMGMTENTPSFVNLVIQWLADNPGWSGLVVFLISLGESLVVVGLFIPGTVVMFGIGALVAMGGMNLWDTLMWSIAGAIVGDGISFWVGHHYRDAMRTFYPFNKHPDWLQRAEIFFARHGGKSVVFGRFAGPVRPIIPVVAGMMGMPPSRFYVVNIISALLWAPSYILPGVVLGASLSLAAGVTTRLAILVVLVIGLLWFTTWGVGQLYRRLQPHTYRFVTAVLCKCFPHHTNNQALFELSMILILATVFFVMLLGWQRPLSMDSQAYFLFQNLRTPWADQLMVLIAGLGTFQANLWVASAGAGWLIWQRHWEGLGHWMAALALGTLAATLLRWVLPLYPPTLALEAGNPLLFRVDLTMGVLLYGFWTVLIARELSAFWRVVPYSLVSMWIVGELLASLYLAQYWLSDAVLNIALSLIWVALLGLAYRRRFAPNVQFLKLSAALVAGLWVAGSWHILFHHADTVKHYRFEYPNFSLVAENWWQQDWDQIPAHRVDWGGGAAQPFTVQYAGDLDFLRDQLLQRGWQESPPLTVAAALQWLNPTPSISEIPIFPKIHDGQYEVLQLMRIDGSSRFVLRLWQTHTQLNDQWAVWAGQVNREILKKSLELLTLPRTDADLLMPLQILQTTLQDFPQRSPNNYLLLLHQP